MSKMLYTSILSALFSFTLLFTVNSFAKVTATFDPAIVVRISDGDTIAVTPVNASKAASKSDEEPTKPVKLSIRMIGTDTPELHLPDGTGKMVAQLPWGQLATDYINKLIQVGDKVTIQNYGLDRYGRTIGRVFHGRGDINFQMVKSGWALPYIICWGKLCNKDFFKNEHVKEYLKACHMARAQGLGVFNPKKPLKELPMQFRLRIQKRQPDKWMGDVTNLKLYPPGSFKKVDICNAVFFKVKSEAVKLGFTPVQ